MSRLRTSTPWTTPTTPLGARILSEEPATLEAVPTMTLVEMEAVLATSSPMPVATPRSTPLPTSRSTPEGPRRAARGGWAVGRRVLAAAAVLVALVGGTGGLAVGAGRPSVLGPASVTAPAPSASPSSAALRGEASARELAAALGEVMAVRAPAQGSSGPATVPANRTVPLPASVVRVHAHRAEAEAGASPTAAVVGAAMGDVAARMATPSAELAAAHP